MYEISLAIILSPLLGALISGILAFTGKSKKGGDIAAILGVLVACVLSLWVLYQFCIGNGQPYTTTLYHWATIGSLNLEVGVYIDRLTAIMMGVVTFVSLMVHIYTIGYMKDDPGYQRFFCYTALFTFAMLMLVMSNNFLQLFFGWEGVGVVSYLLIGFWYKKDTATFASMKAFLVNRVGDLGFILGIGGVLALFGTLDYQEVFAQIPQFANAKISIFEGVDYSYITVICLLLFIGAMGKSAQVPLHVWLPDSMEGPTPISALIHAATMVTAGIFMVARMAPMFEMSEAALSTVMVIGAITAFFMGILGVVQNDIKRIIAYSTLSQLGYMMVALGASAYAAGIFHLMTHAFFKALLFLGAGSVIIAMHHEQDIRNMGGLRKYVPITFITGMLGTLALIGFPGFSGFYSKDAIIEAVHASTLPGAGIAYWAVLSGVFFTALYSFRLIFIVFYGKERMSEETKSHLHEPGPVVWGPLVLLAVPSVAVAWFSAEAILFKDFLGFEQYIKPEHNTLLAVKEHFHGILAFALHAPVTVPFWLMVSGILVAWLCYIKFTHIPAKVLAKTQLLNRVLANKYGFDQFNEQVIAKGSRGMGDAFWRFGDMKLIDGLLVNGSAKAVQVFSSVIRHIQTGYIYHYALAMVVGLLIFLLWL